MRFSYSYNGSTFSSPSPSSLAPPTPNDSLLDITPCKSSLSSSMGMSSAYAFPSWPNRPSLLSPESGELTANSYLSDEDLFPRDLPITPPSKSAIDEDSGASDRVYLPSGADDLTTEEQIQMMRAAAEEDERRLQFQAYVHAHVRAQQAFKVAQLAAAERENAKRNKKKRPVASTKHRSTSSTEASRI